MNRKKLDFFSCIAFEKWGMLKIDDTVCFANGKSLDSIVGAGDLNLWIFRVTEKVGVSC